MLTEATATTKLCPVQFTAELGGTPCCASSCMAWRWESYRGLPTGTGDEKRGYCGAFGIPMETIV